MPIGGRDDIVGTPARPSEADILRRAVAAAGQGTWEWSPAGDRVTLSPAARTLLGLGAEEPVDGIEPWLVRIHDEDRPWVLATLQAEHAPFGTFQIDCRAAAGKGWRWLRWTGTALPGSGGRAAALVGLLVDVTEERRARENLARSEARHNLAYWGADDGLWEWDLQEARLHLSARAHEMLGIVDTGEDLDPGFWMERANPDDAPQLRYALDAVAAGKVPNIDHELRIRVGTGQEVWMRLRGRAVSPDGGPPRRIAGMLTNINDRKLAELRMARIAYQDQLTGLPNRVRLMERLQAAVMDCLASRSQGCALIHIDIDRFSRINDSLGLVVGDELLLAAAGAILRARSDTRDFVARLGADEFALLIEDVAQPGAAMAAAFDIATELMQPMRLSGRTVDVTASVGVALWDPTVVSPEEMLRDASLALVRAKAGGGGRVQLFERGLRENAQRRLEIDADLRTALGRGELELHYQPVVDLETTALRGFEALVRWRHPSRGLVRPADFIPSAEESGLIVAIGQWTMAEAARQLASWRERFPDRSDLFMSVNLSGRQLADHTLLTDINAVLRATRLPPRLLKLEITETALLGDPEQAAAMLRGLRGLGVQIWLDDFGTGYSSLGYLYRLPLDGLKVDRSFVEAVERDEKRLGILQAIVALGRTLGLELVAEGIEGPLEIAYLRSLNCSLGQGYYFSRPLPADAAEAWLARP